MDEIVALYKPVGPTSHDMVDEVRKIVGTRRVGHAGTLDPLASGIMILGIGKATKQLGTLSHLDKEYRATIYLGEISTTDDAEGKKTKRTVDHPPPESEIKAVLTRFEGKIEQTPPVYSAVKIRGKEAYKYARSGKKVTLKPRSVLINRLILETYAWPRLTLNINCGPGVYIRALARDIGKALGTGAYLESLERLRVGKYKSAISLPEFARRQLNQRVPGEENAPAPSLPHQYNPRCG